MNDTLIGQIEKTLAQSEHWASDVIRTVALWVNEADIDLYAEDRAKLVNSLLDQANMKTLHDEWIEGLADKVMESYYRSQVNLKNTFSDDQRVVGSVVREIANSLYNHTGKLDISLLSELADVMQGK